MCICRQWLQELELGLTAAEESAPLLDNQLRNGVLLCDLAGIVPVDCYATIFSTVKVYLLLAL